jgi:hypothetical protein
MDLGGTFDKTTWWDLQLEGRYFLGPAAASQSWILAGAGVVKAVDSITAYVGQLGGDVPARKLSTWAPVVAVGAGYDFEIVRYFGIAPELRLQFYGLNREPGPVLYRPQTALLLGVSLLGLGDYR